jgi:hypothetical protein
VPIGSGLKVSARSPGVRNLAKLDVTKLKRAVLVWSEHGFSKNVEAVVLALERRGVAITEHGIELTKRKR